MTSFRRPDGRSVNGYLAEAMRSRGPRAVVVTIPGCGHAPALYAPDQFALVERTL